MDDSRAAWRVMESLMRHVLGATEKGDIPLRDLVIAEAFEDWTEEEALERLSKELGGFMLTDYTEYLTPHWARVILVAADDTSSDGVLRAGEPVLAWGAYLRYVDELRGWRFAKIDSPNLTAEEMLP